MIDGWRIAFLSEPGDLPSLEVTSGRLTGPDDANILIDEFIKGDAAKLIFDSSDPSLRHFTVTELTADALYAFKVAATNSVGEGVLSAASVTVSARAGASALHTTASGSALAKGISGWIREEQIIQFGSESCISDKFILSFQDFDKTKKSCNSSATDFEDSLNGIFDGDVYVTRRDLTTINGLSGYSWTVTFVSFIGDAPSLEVDLAQVNNGVDASDKSGPTAQYVTEFLKGKANEFIIEPKKSSGAVVKDMNVIDGREGMDIFILNYGNQDHQ